MDNSVATRWATCLSGMSAGDRCAHLFCELSERLSASDRAVDGEFPLPITQQALADVLGVSAVHVSRTLHELRADGLATFAHRKVAIHNFQRLAEFGHFDPAYLQR